MSGWEGKHTNHFEAQSRRLQNDTRWQRCSGQFAQQCLKSLKHKTQPYGTSSPFLVRSPICEQRRQEHLTVSACFRDASKLGQLYWTFGSHRWLRGQVLVLALLRTTENSVLSTRVPRSNDDRAVFMVEWSSPSDVCGRFWVGL